MKILTIIIIILFPIQLLFSYGDREITEAMSDQIHDLSDNDKRLLSFTNVIMINSNKWPVPIHDYNGILLSDIVISDKLVKSYTDRFKIAHYIRNQMISHVKEAKPYYFPEYDSYITKNAPLICNVIYYLISKKFYKLYINFPGECNSFFNDNRLGTNINIIKNKLEKEGLEFPLGYY